MARTVARSPKAGKSTARSATVSYITLYEATPMERIRRITEGVPAAEAKRWLENAALGRSTTLKALDLPVATFNKKVKARTKLSPAESERVVGFARLVGQIEAMVGGASGTADFDARAWLARWLTEPLPALGNAKPIDLMNTMEGQNLVSQKLAQIAGGAYA